MTFTRRPEQTAGTGNDTTPCGCNRFQSDNTAADTNPFTGRSPGVRQWR